MDDNFRVEERHKPDYPWPEPRAQGTVISSRAEAVLVRWDTGGEQWVDKDRIGSKPTDLIRFVKRAASPSTERNAIHLDAPSGEGQDRHNSPSTERRTEDG